MFTNKLTHDVDGNPATEVSNHYKCHLASNSHLTLPASLSRCHSTAGLDKVVNVAVGQEDEDKSGEVETMEYSHRILPTRDYFICQVDGYTDSST